MWALSKNMIKMVKGFTQQEVKVIEMVTELDKDIETYKQIKGTPKKTYNNHPSLINFLSKSEMEKELIRVQLREKAYKLITE